MLRVVVAEEIGMSAGFHPCAMHQGLRGVGGADDQVGAGTAGFDVVDRSDFQFGSVLSEFLRELVGFFSIASPDADPFQGADAGMGVDQEGGEAAGVDHKHFFRIHA